MDRADIVDKAAVSLASFAHSVARQLHPRAEDREYEFAFAGGVLVNSDVIIDPMATLDVQVTTFNGLEATLKDVPQGHHIYQVKQDINHHLASQCYFAGNHFSVADITALVTVDFAQWAKVKIPEQHKNLLHWHALVSERPSVLSNS